MKKTISILAVIVVLILIMAVILTRAHNQNQQRAGNEPSGNATSTLEGLKVPVQLSGLKWGTKTLLDTRYVNPGTAAVLTFSSDENTIDSRNPAFNILINGKRVGQVTAELVSDLKFSPDNRYLSFETGNVTSALHSDYSIAIIDFKDAKVLSIPAPMKISDAPQKDPSISPASAYIEAYNLDSNVVDVTAFFTGVDKSEKIYRISPKELWQYDLTTGKYTFIKDLPE